MRALSSPARLSVEFADKVKPAESTVGRVTVA